MRPSELAQVLRAANPWWSRRHRVTWVTEDVALSQRARHEWAPATRVARAALSEIGPHLNPGTATVLVGPRGVGKTTAAKDAVLRVLSDLDIDPRAVVWVPVEPTADDPFPGRDPLDAGDLENVLRRATRVGAPACDGPRLVVIDEASACPGWADALAGGAPHTQVLVTASVAGSAVESLPERYPGQLLVRHLRPSTLAELLVATQGDDAETVRTGFISHGGFPRALAEHRDLGEVSHDFVELLAEGLRRDLCADHPCRLDDVLSALCRTAGRFVEPAALAAALELSPGQVTTLLERMADAGVLDPRRGLVDPLLHRLPALRDPSRTAPSAEHVAAFSL